MNRSFSAIFGVRGLVTAFSRSHADREYMLTGGNEKLYYAGQSFPHTVHLAVAKRLAADYSRCVFPPLTTPHASKEYPS
jgi:hypothetical protein